MSTLSPITRLAAGVFYDAASLNDAVTAILAGGLNTACVSILGSLPSGVSGQVAELSQAFSAGWPFPLSRFPSSTLDELARHIDDGGALLWVKAPSNVLLDLSVRALLAHSSHPVHGEQIAV